MTSALIPLAGNYISGDDGILMPIWEKTPWELKDYPFDWALHLVGDEQVSAVQFITSSPQLSVLSENIADGLATQSVTIVWLYGGVLNTNYSVTIRVTTSKGRQLERTFELAIGHN